MRRRFSWLVLAPTLAVSLLLLVLGGAAAWYAHRLNKDVSENLSKNLAAVLAAERLVLEVRDVRTDMNRLADTGDPSHLESATASRREIERSLHEVGRTSSSDAARALYRQTREGYDQYAARLEQLHAGTAAQPLRKESATLLSLLAESVVAPAEELLELRRAEAHASSDRNKAIASRVGLGLLLLGVCGAVAGVLAGYAISRGVHRSVVQLSLPVRDMAGQLNALVGPITVSSEVDLTQLETAMRTLADKTTDVVRRFQEQQEQTLRSEQLAAVGQLAAGLAHELRNPLMSMKLLVQASLEREDSESPRLRDLSIVEQEISRLEEMLQTFLDFARPPRLNVEPLEVAHLIETTLHIIRPRASQQQVEIHIITPDQTVTVESDRSQLRQLLLNLLLNALDALPGGGNIWVTLFPASGSPGAATCRPSVGSTEHARGDEHHAGDRRHVEIHITDDGPGLPADKAEQIFDPFVSTKDTGIGLGLSICRRIAEAHGGHIAATNQQAGGAAFIISLPIGGLSAIRPTHDDSGG